MPSAVPAAAVVAPPGAQQAPPAAPAGAPPQPAATPTGAAVPAAGPQSMASVGEELWRRNAPTTDSRWIQAAGKAQHQKDFQAFQEMGNEAAKNLIADNSKYQTGIDAAAEASVGMSQNLNQMASMILKMDESGFGAPGQLAPYRLALQRTVNDVIGTVSGLLGVDPNQYQINEEDIVRGTAADKIGRFMSFAAANGAGQNSLGGLETAKAMVPTTAQSKEEAIQLMAGMYIDKQRALDMQNYVREYIDLGRGTGMPEYYLVRNAMNAFRRETDYNDQAYNLKKRALAAMMTQKNKNGVTMFEYAMKKGVPAREIEEAAAYALYGRKDVPPIKGMANIIYGM